MSRSVSVPRRRKGRELGIKARSAYFPGPCSSANRLMGPSPVMLSPWTTRWGPDAPRTGGQVGRLLCHHLLIGHSRPLEQGLRLTAVGAGTGGEQQGLPAGRLGGASWEKVTWLPARPAFRRWEAVRSYTFRSLNSWVLPSFQFCTGR